MSDTKKDDGGAAFPGVYYGEIPDVTHQGMSIRDWFAGQALGGCFASDRWIDGVDKTAANLGVEFAAAIAVMAYKYADAMIAERNKS